MAVALETAQVTIKQSIARVELFTPAAFAPMDWTIKYYFENGPYDANDKLIGPTTFGTRDVSRKFGDIASMSFTTSDGTLTATGAQIADLIKQAGYVLRQADIDAAETAQQS
jgi:hypothetical protein